MKNNLNEWRIPIINRYIRAEMIDKMLIFSVVDRNSDRVDVVGYWDASDRNWYFIGVFKHDADKLRERARRIMIMIMRRYPARVTRLQNELVKL